MDDGQQPAVTVAVLGPFAVLVDGAAVHLPGRLRSLLAALAVGAGAPVTVERLVDVVWGEDLPAAPQQSLQVLVRRLRIALGDGTVETVPGGYRLNLPAEHVDVASFSALLDVTSFAALMAARRADDPAAERRRLSDALALWRGTPFDGVDSAALRAVDTPRLVEQRLTALARRIEIDLAGPGAGALGADAAGADAAGADAAGADAVGADAVGEDAVGEDAVGEDAVGEDPPSADAPAGADTVADSLAALVDELQELTAEYPLQERFWGQLMTALARSGRRDEALEAYRRLDRTLSDELGIGPGEGVRRLHREIVAAEDPPDAEPAGWIPRQLPLGTMGFSGREGALAELDALLTEGVGAGPTPRVAVLDGAGGVGKTSTALHWAHRVAGRFPDGQLYANLRGFDPASSSPVPASTVARTFLEALGVAKGRIPASDDAQLALYRGVVAGRRVLVVLDNARDAEQVLPLLPGSGPSVSVVTSRTSLTSLVAAAGARRVPLDTLSPSEGIDLLATRVGVERSLAEPEAARQIVDRCAGLPLAIVIASARVLAQPAFPMSAVAVELADDGARLDALGDDDPMADVRSVFSTSYRALSPRAARMFRLLGIHPGPDISRAATVPLLGESDGAARLAMAELLRVNLVAEHTPGRYAMHDLVAEYARERAQHDVAESEHDAAVQRLTEWYLGVALEMDRRRWPGRVRQAFVRDPGVVEVPDREPAAWFSDERTILLAVVEIARTRGLFREVLSLAWAIYSTVSNHFDTRKALWAALWTARDVSIQVQDRLAEVWCTRYLAALAGDAGRIAECEELRRRTVELAVELDDARVLQQAYQGYAGDLVRWGRTAEAVRQAEHSLEHGRRSQEAYYEAHALNILAWALSHGGELARALPLAEEALALLNDVDNPTTRAVIWDTIGFVHAELGDPGRAIVCYQEAAVRFRAFDMRQDLVKVQRRLAHLLGDVGRWAEARDAWQECLDLHIGLGLTGVAETREELARAAKLADGAPDLIQTVRPPSRTAS
ncbi:BTAD domain-containing putative transcriptional regulator [Promicromonospora sp. AC04]|uniref:AfsR/SARP family transcriptional regulator n=1 Tax=Promicromonospora sp. AC04 TaxID=2135723 RepID=UPI0013049901|nr:BTAD domain-containing putative transcriptional regulator [Promicromonospora sp. AC04]